MGGEVRSTPDVLAMLDLTAEAIEQHSSPGDVLLDLSASPMFHVLREGPGEGHSDLLMPGTFLDEAEDSAILERIEAARYEDETASSSSVVMLASRMNW